MVLSFLGVFIGILFLFAHIYKPTQCQPANIDIVFKSDSKISSATSSVSQSVYVVDYSNDAKKENYTSNFKNNSVIYMPIVNISYNVQGQNKDNRQVLVVPRRAYYDNRIVKGKPRTIVVILSEVEDNTVKDIVACEINGYYSKSVNIIKDDVSWVRWHKKGYTHCSVTVQCLGLPEAAILNGSTTHVIYKKKAESFYSRVETEKPLLITSPAVRSGSVLMCATLFGHPRNLDAWLKYQKTIGVDLVRLNVHPSFSQNATHITPYLKEAIDSGFVLMETWNDIVGERFYYYGKQVRYQDCVYRYMNTYEFALFLDHDDFFNPLIPNHNSIHYYLDKLFADNKTGSVYFQWKLMECAPKPEALDTLPDGNLTSILSGYNNTLQIERKCAHRLRAVDSVKIHRALSFLPGYKAVDLKSYKYKPLNIAYVAHNRWTAKLC